MTVSLGALLALELAALGQMGVLVGGVAGATLPEFLAISGIGQLDAIAFTWSLGNQLMISTHTNIAFQISILNFPVNYLIGVLVLLVSKIINLLGDGDGGEKPEKFHFTYGETFLSKISTKF